MKIGIHPQEWNCSGFGLFMGVDIFSSNQKVVHSIGLIDFNIQSSWFIPKIHFSEQKWKMCLSTVIFIETRFDLIWL